MHLCVFVLIIRHNGPVWQLAWAHPKYGSLLASCSYDGKVIVWREGGAQGQFQKLAEHALHQASVNSVAWSPPEYGAMLLCSSSDGSVSVLELREDGSWDTRTFTAHAVGCNSACWAPSSVPLSNNSASDSVDSIKRFATAGSDNLVKIWAFNSDTSSWDLEETLQGHTDWVRDVAWASNVGLPKSYLASAGQVSIIVLLFQSFSPLLKSFLLFYLLSGLFTSFIDSIGMIC